MDNADDLGPDWVEEGLANALKGLFQDWAGPLIPEETLLTGAMKGFDPAIAETVLSDRESLAWLNARWNVYEDATGVELPMALQSRLAEERRYGGDQWNLRVTHAAGHGWTDDETDDALFALIAQELSASTFDESQVAHARARGAGAEAAEAAEPWEVYLRSQHFLILLRRDAEGLVVEALSDSKSGLFELTLRWADGASLTRPVQIRAGEANRLVIEPPSGELPVSASVRVAPAASGDAGTGLAGFDSFGLVLAEQQDFTLAAATRQEYEPAVAESPDGVRLVAQPVSDRQTYLSLSVPSALAREDQIVRAIIGDGDTARTVLLILVADPEGLTSEYMLDTDRPTVPRVALASPSGLDVADLDGNDLAALARSVAGASLRCKDAWLRVAQGLPESHPLVQAIRAAFE